MKHLAALLMSALLFVPAAAHAEGSGRCPSTAKVIVEVRGVALAVPRTMAYRVLLDDGVTRISLGRATRNYDCKTPVIKNARGLATAGFTVGFMGGLNGSEKHFNALRAAMLDAPNLSGSSSEKLPDGIEEVSVPLAGQLLFRLPADAAPTFDKMPVTFICDNSETPELAKIIPQYCTAAYIHPSGLPLVYSVARKDYAKDDFFAADKAKRKVLEDMIAGAKGKFP